MEKHEDIFSFRDYKKYIKIWLKKSSSSIGIKSRFALSMKCQPAYLTHVLNGKAHLSPDQALAASEFMGHSDLESQYFLNLIHLGRASTLKFKNFVENELRKLKNERLDLQNKINVPVLSEEETLNVFYSSWHYSAIHVALGISKLNSASELSKAFDLPISLVEEALKFLVHAGLAQSTGSAKYVSMARQTHLPKASPKTLNHHTNWRLRALADLVKNRPENLHYSSVISINEKDEGGIRKILNRAIEDIRQLVRASQNESAVYSYGIDFFNISRIDT